MSRLLLPTLLLALSGTAACDAPAPPARDAGSAGATDAAVSLEALRGEVQLSRGQPDASAPAVAGPLRDGDLVQTGAGAAATLRLPDGRSVELGPGARLRVRAREGHVELEVLQGVVLSRTPAADAGPLLLRTPQGLTRVEGRGEVQVAVEEGEARVEVRLGAVQLIGPGGSPTRAAVGDVLRVTAGRVEVLSRAPRVVALAPLRVTVRAAGSGVQLRRQGERRWRSVASDGETLAEGDALRTGGAAAQLSLQGSSASLLLQEGSELSFEGGVSAADGGGALDEARVQLLRGTLHWRVTGADGARVAQGAARLAPEPPRRTLARLRNEVSEGTERTTIFYQDTPPGVTFTWSAVLDAAQYRLTVYRADALGVPVVDRTTAQPRLELEAGSLGEGRYLWSATPLSAALVPLRGGRMNKLELAYDNSVPTLVLNAPRNGERAGTGRVRVAGVAPVGSSLWVNGQPLTLDAKGRFDARVAPTGQPPLVQLMMVRPGAPAVLTVRRLR